MAARDFEHRTKGAKAATRDRWAARRLQKATESIP